MVQISALQLVKSSSILHQMAQTTAVQLIISSSILHQMVQTSSLHLKILADLLARSHASDIGRFRFSQVFASLHWLTQHDRAPMCASASGGGQPWNGVPAVERPNKELRPCRPFPVVWCLNILQHLVFQKQKLQGGS